MVSCWNIYRIICVYSFFFVASYAEHWEDSSMLWCIADIYSFLLLNSNPHCIVSQTVHSSTVDGRLGHFQFRATVDNAAINVFVCVWYTCECISVWYTPKTGLLGYGVHMFNFRGSYKRFSKWLYQFTLPSSFYERFSFSTHFSTLGIVKLLNCSHYCGRVVVSLLVSICSSD